MIQHTERPRPRALETIPLGGALVGIFDLLFAFIFYGLILKAPALRIFQSVAAGVLGRTRATEGGVKTFVLGLVLHFVVATCIATVYYLITITMPFVLRYAIPSGLAYGMIAYLGMNYVVIPLSAIGPRTTSKRTWIIAVEIIGHAFLVGLPLALLARRSARNQPQEHGDTEPLTTPRTANS
ncbi:MAG TPA: hypothetical protein VLE19_07380 [Pyrinomonadaceae bacterium]|nr:hypothetical protein [Pyrinomonadaceae bacterium]